jgi:hypothetical protein
MRELFPFPDPVNEKAARVVAGFVLAGLESIFGYCLAARRSHC